MCTRSLKTLNVYTRVMIIYPCIYMLFHVYKIVKNINVYKVWFPLFIFFFFSQTPSRMPHILRSLVLSFSRRILSFFFLNILYRIAVAYIQVKKILVTLSLRARKIHPSHESFVWTFRHALGLFSLFFLIQSATRFRTRTFEIKSRSRVKA